MRLSATYRGADDPFEGDRVVELRALPAGAVIQRATLTVTPANATPAAPRAPFEEHFVFGAARAGELAAAGWGVTATPAAASVEVALHARRTLAAVAGTRIGGSTLTVDVGGLYVELNDNGAVRAPGDDAFSMTADGALPGVTVPGFRLTAGAAGQPGVDTVVVRSAPANVTTRLGTMGPFWAHTGELAAPQTTPDFAETLTTFLLGAEVRDGSYVIPFAVHADGVARLDLEIELEYLLAASPLPAGLPEAVLPFDLSTFARSGSAELSVRLPAGAQVVPGATRARIQGAFEATRIAAAADPEIMPPPAQTTVTVDRAAAQALAPQAEDVLASGFDLCLAPLEPSARLTLTLLADGDGKPFGPPLLRAPLEIALSRERSRAAAWITVALDEPFHLEHGRRYWLVLQALDGEASWGAVAASSTALPSQASDDGGFSWSVATDAQLAGPLTALHRLRITPDRFTMPVAIDVGGERLTLEEFEPLQRIDFTIDGPKLAGALTAAVASAGANNCPPGEHLANPGLDDWIGVGDELRHGEALTLAGDPRALARAPDGRRAYVASVRSTGESEGVLLETVSLGCGTASEPVELDGEDPLSIALDRSGTRAYVLIDADGPHHLAIVDLDAGAPVGEAISVRAVHALAVAPDGERLLLLEQDEISSGGASTAVVTIDAVDTRALERAAIDEVPPGRTQVARVVLNAGEVVAPELPAAFAVAASGDGTLLVFAVQTDAGAPSPGRLVLVSEEQPQAADSVPLGASPRALAVSHDKRRIVVACAADSSLSVVSIDAPGAYRSTSIRLAAVPVDVTLSADGTRAAVLSATDVTVYDLESGRLVAQAIVDPDPVPEAGPVALAGSAGLDMLLVARGSDGSLVRLATDAAPLDWVLTSGAVEPYCFDGDLAALLGAPRVQRQVDRVDAAGAASGSPTAAGDEPQPREPSSISQVVAVSGGCRYTFSFRALADQPASEGEVLWRSGDCGLSRSDRVPITEFEPSPDEKGKRADPKLVLHRVTLDAPPGTTQAEVRFTAPPGGAAGVGSVSLRGSDAAGADTDFQEQADGAPGAWAADPGGAPLALEPGARGSAAQIVNSAAAPGTLVQSFAVSGGLPLVVDVRGRTTAPGGDPGPQLGVRFLDEQGAAVGEPVVVALTRHAFDHVVAETDAPAAAARAEVRLTLPAGATVELEHVRPSQPTHIDVPITFRAAAPGELAVSAAAVVYDVHTAPTPTLPPTGVCTPTAPGRAPGAPDEKCGCCCADHDRHRVNASHSRREGGRRLAMGAGLLPGPPAAHHPLTGVRTVGPVRAAQLARAGIVSAERLADASPRVVARAVGGLSARAARAAIDHARELVSPPDPP